VTVPAGPLDLLEVLAVQEAWVTPNLRHLELFTARGLLTVLWHGDPDASGVVVACGGAMGGLLGPADGLYQDLGDILGPGGIGLLRIGYRKPNDLPGCVLDLCAAADMAGRCGAERVVTMGHSFGGAVAVGAALALGAPVAGVVTLATQSAGCEGAGGLATTPLLMFHGTADELLPVQASEVVRMLAGGEGELVVVPGAGHLLREAGALLRERLTAWIPEVLRGDADAPL
jgi:Phospholipase/Carboxylesterase